MATTVFKDERIDKLVGWGFNFAAVVALSIGGYFFVDLRASIKEQSAGIVAVRKDLADGLTEVHTEIGNLRIEIVELKHTRDELQEIKARLLKFDDRFLELEREKRPR